MNALVFLYDGECLRAGVEVTLQCVYLAAENVPKRLHLSELLRQATTSL